MKKNITSLALKLSSLICGLLYLYMSRFWTLDPSCLSSSNPVFVAACGGCYLTFGFGMLIGDFIYYFTCKRRSAAPSKEAADE